MSRRQRVLIATAAILMLPAAAQPVAASEPPAVERERALRMRHGAPTGYLFVTGEQPLLRVREGKRGFLGVHVIELTRELRRHFGAGDAAGVLVSRVERPSPAASAGVAVGDVLVAVGGEAIGSSWDLRRVVAPRGDGDEVRLDLVRDRRPRRLAARLEERQGTVVDMTRLLAGSSGRPRGDGPLAPQRIEVLVRELAPSGDPQMGRRRVLEEAAERLRRPEIQARIAAEIESRRALEEKLRRLEARLAELERELRRRRE